MVTAVKAHARRDKAQLESVDLHNLCRDVLKTAECDSATADNVIAKSPSIQELHAALGAAMEE
ncbi:hypothetical protein N7490_005125 [Penicillium lividum]|nr:hypothetical protein N7490_005125 [Penicillium lividum]